MSLAIEEQLARPGWGRGSSIELVEGQGRKEIGGSGEKRHPRKG